MQKRGYMSNMETDNIDTYSHNTEFDDFDIFGLDKEPTDSGVHTEEGKPKTLLIKETSRPINVCAYCRVSTDKRDQANSMEAQRTYFEQAFKRRKNWKMKTIFADKGISGTSIKKRDEFNRMIAEAKKGKYELIITKSVSRFSRNVEHILSFVEDLRRRGVYIWFMTENISTDSDNYREPLINASNGAEAESRAASQRVRWGQRYRMQQGIVFGRKEMFGYNIKRDENNKQYFEIIPEEAELVRRIFKMYADGMGTFKIARRLEQEGIKTKRYKDGWSNTVILRILRNEKYVGDLKQGKTYTVDYISHQKKYNRGEYATHTKIDHHPESAIVSRELWNAVQKRLKENEPTDDAKKKHSNRYWCSGKVFCGECQQRYISHTRHLKSGGIHKSWKCWENQQHGQKKDLKINGKPVVNEETGEIVKTGCDNQSVNEKVLKQGVHDILEVIIKPQMKANYERIKQLILNRKKDNTAENSIKKLEKQLTDLETEYAGLTRARAKGEISEKGYEISSKQIEFEMQEIQDKIAELNRRARESDEETAELCIKLENLRDIVELKEDKISEDLYRTLVDKIEVFNGKILKYYIAGWDNPIVMKYSTKGKMDAYTVEFEILSV